jgi:hypothetical protein
MVVENHDMRGRSERHWGSREDGEKGSDETHFGRYGSERSELKT